MEDEVKKGVFVKTIRTTLLLSLSILWIAGCSPKAMEEKAEVLEAEDGADKNAEALQAVIEKEFSGPDEEYRKLLDAAMMAQNDVTNQEEFDALMETPVYQDYITYMEDTYAKYFTENGLENFLNSTPAFMYSVFDGDYKLAPSDIEITQNDQEPTLYHFTFNVNWTGEEAETASFSFDGRAMVPKEGKIGTIQFGDMDGLRTKLSEAGVN